MPLTLQDFRTATISANLFVLNRGLRGTHLLRILPEAFLARFEGDPFMLPRTEGAPLEIPRLMLQNPNTGWTCQFTGERIAIAQSEITNTAPAIVTADFYREARDLFFGLWDEIDIRPNRVAAVGIRYARQTNPGPFLVRHFCRTDRIEGPNAPLNRAENFELHAHKTYRMANEFNVNSWMRVKTGTSEPDAAPVVIVEQDTNTKPENAAARELPREQVQRFFDTISAEQDHVLNLYFPQ
jgi:hypothetical protein